MLFSPIKLIHLAVMRHELVSTLQSLLSEQKKADKEYESSSSAVAKLKEFADVPIILSPDNATRKHRHTTKNLYQSKGALVILAQGQHLTCASANAIVADVYGAIQGADHAIVGVDLHPTAWNAITASQTWIANDAVWRTLLDETPELQKEVGMQLREHINGKRAAGHKLIFLFSLRDEKLFLYHLT